MQKHRNNNVAPIGLSSLRTWIGTPSGWPAIVMPRAWTAWLQLQEDEFEALDDQHFLEPGPLLSRIFLLSFVGFAWVSEQYPMVLNYRGWGCFCVFFLTLFCIYLRGLRASPKPFSDPA